MLIEDLALEAQRTGLLSRVGETIAPVSCVINIASDGTYLGLIRIGKPGKPEGVYLPSRIVRSGLKVKANLLADSSKYVLGHGGGDRPSRECCFNSFVELTREAAKIKPEIQAAVNFLLSDAVNQCIEDYKRDFNPIKDTGNLAFMVDGKYIHDYPEIREFWLPLSQDVEPVLRNCQACGKECYPVKLHSPIKGGFNAQLVSFNSTTTCSYGLKGAANAPICPKCAVGYTVALQKLLTDYPHPDTGEILKRSSITLNDTTRAVWWQDGGEPIALGEIWEKGKESLIPSVESEAASTGFFCLVLSKYGRGRVTIDSYKISPVLGVDGETGILDSLQAYYEDLKLGDNQFKDKYAIYTLEKALWPNSKTVNPHFRDLMFMVATQGAKFPYWLAPNLLHRIAINISSSKRDKPKPVWHLVSLLKAVLRRNYNNGKGSSMEAKPVLNEDNTNNGYLFGRYFAIVENMHFKAIKPNNTLANSHYNMAASYPRSVVGVLQSKKELSVNKCPWLRGLSNQAEQQFGRMTEIPKVFNVEDKSWFALGYTQQKTILWEKKEKPEDNTALILEESVA